MSINPNLILALEALPLLLGFLMTFPFGARFVAPFHGRWPSLATERGRMLAGMLLMGLSGFIVSTHTWWIHTRITQIGGSFCASDSVFSCDDVIGHEIYGYAPVIDQPWGLVGMLVFIVLLYATLVLQKEPESANGERAVLAMLLLTGGGMGVIALLVSYEIRIEKLCQYCTTAHVANVFMLISSWRVWRAMKDGAWTSMGRPNAS